MTNIYNTDDFYDSDEDLDLYVNLDSPDIEHINVFNDDTEEDERCLKVTTFDFNGDPSHSIFNLQSLEYLLDSLNYGKKSLEESLQNEDDEEWLENV